MRLKIQGKLPRKLKKPLVVAATRWYAKHLLPPDIYKKLHLTVNFKVMEDNLHAEVPYRQPKKHNYRYVINITNECGPKFSLMTLGHEVVHVVQYATMEYWAQDTPDPIKVRWQGTWIDSRDMDYEDYPWEIIAHGKEQGLYYRMINYMVENDKV
jgi:hypothetical protein